MPQKPIEPETPKDQIDVMNTFLDQATSAMGETSEDISTETVIAPEHRRLHVYMSSDKMTAYIQALYKDTTSEEIQAVLKQNQIEYGIQQTAIEHAHQKAIDTGHVQKDVLVAQGTPAQYRKQKDVSYTFLQNRIDPATKEPADLGSSLFSNIYNVLCNTDIEKIRGYNRPTIAVSANTALMTVQGKDEIEPGCDVFGNAIKRVATPGQQLLKAGDGVLPEIDGGLTSDRYGYLSVQGNALMVVSPIWISPDRMAAYFVNPPQMTPRINPTKADILNLLTEANVTTGIDHEAIDNLCADLDTSKTREACVRIAKGKTPDLSKGQFLLAIDPHIAMHFETVRSILRSTDAESADLSAVSTQAVNIHTMIARQATQGDTTAPGEDIFGLPIATPETGKKSKSYQAGLHVRKEEKDGYVYFISEIFGYAGIIKDQLTVLPPIWISPDRMIANFMALPIEGKPPLPGKDELHALIKIAHIHHGVDEKALVRLTETWPEKHLTPIAQGTAPIPGDHGTIDLLFKHMPDPGKYLETGKIDFRERETVPQTTPGALLATRSFPTPGTPGMDVRGRKLPPPKSDRGILFAGTNVRAEDEGDMQHFYATDSGWPRVVKDTLGVMKRFVHQGNVDYRVGNLDIDGDVEIEGTVKSRFVIKATGDVTIGGAVEMNAQIEANGNITVQRGIHKARIKANGDLAARFIQDSNIDIAGNLLVANYAQNCDLHIGGVTIIQGKEGSQKQLCLLGGTLASADTVDVASIGTAYGRPTRVVAGFSVEIEKKFKRYKQGLDFCAMRTRKGARALESLFGRQASPVEQLSILKQAPPQKRQFALEHMKELQSLKQVQESLEHHLQDLEKSKQEHLQNVEIRVKNSCFQKTQIQIGQIYETLSKEEQGIVFYLDKKGNKIIRKVLTPS